MKIIFLFINILFFSIPLISQRLTFAIESFPNYNKTSFGNKLIESKNNFTTDIGISMFFDLSEKFQLTSGFKFRYSKLEITDYSIFLSEGYTKDNYRKSYIKANQLLYYVAVPFNMKHKFFGEVNHFYYITGIDLFFKLKDKSKIIYHESGGAEFELKNNKNTFNVLPTFGLGFEFRLANLIKLYFEPRYRFSVTKYNILKKSSFASNINSGRQSSFGMVIGMRFLKSN